MADLATLGLVFETKGAEQAVRTLDQVAQKAGMAEGATENLSSAQMQGRKASDDLAGAARRTAKATDTLAAATDGATVAQMRYNSAQTMAWKGARLASYEMVNLGRQLGDVATMAALGASPMMILSTQGLQIAEIFGVARQRGVGFAGALGQLAGTAGSLLIRFLPFAAVIGGAVGAFSMFQKAVDESTEGATTWGDTWQATINVVGSAIMDGPIGRGLQWLGRMFAATFQAIAGVVISATDHIVGRMGAAYQLITQNWRRLPQVFGVLGQSAANAFLDHIEDMINTAIRGVNMLLEKVGMATLGLIDIPEIRLANAQIAAEYDSLSQSISASFRAARLDFVDQVAREAERLAAAKDEAAGASQRQTAALRPETQAIDEQARAFADLLERLKTPAEKELERLTADMRTLRIELDEGRISLQQYRDLFDRLWTAQPQLVRAVTEEIITLSDEARQLPSALDQWREGLEEVESMTSAIRWAVDDVARAIENKDWGSVFAGLLRTLERVKDLWNSGQPGGRYSAAGSLFSAAGSAVGGTGGMVLGAVGSGFSAAGSAAGLASMGGLGASIAGLAGPIGIAVAGFTLLSSVLSNDAAKKRAKAEQEARDMANARQIAEQQAAKQAELQIELLRAQGDELGAVAMERERELAALDRTSAALQRQIYALEDWRKAVTDAESAVSKAEADLRAAYDAERERLLGIIGAADDARAALTQAYNRERSAIEATVSGVESLVDGLRAFRRELDLNPLAMGSPLAGRSAALTQFQNAAPSELAGAGRTLLTASQASARNMIEFQRDRALVARAIDRAAAAGEAQLSEAERQIALLDQQVSGLIAANDNLMSVEQAIANLLTAEQAAMEAQAQLAALDAQVGALINLNSSVLSVGQAIQNLAQATAALAQANASRPDTSSMGPTYEAVGFEGYVDRNPDLASLYASGTGMARGRSKAEFGQYHWERYGQGEDRYFRPFAAGGAFAGGMVSGPTAFPMGIMGEAGPEAIMPLANVGGRMGVIAANDGLRDELRALRQEMAAMRAAAEQTARNTEDTRDVLEGAARNQTPLYTTSEAA